MKTIHLLGDSLVTAYGSDEDNIIGGWGDHLGTFFDKKINVRCYGQGGRSTRSFLNEGRFEDTGAFNEDMWPFGMGPACNSIKAGDYVFMEFAHNDDYSKGRATLVDRLTPLGTPDKAGRYPVIEPVESMKVSTEIFPANYESILKSDGMTEADIEKNRLKYEEILPTYGDKYYSYDCGATYKGFLKHYVDKIRALSAIPVFVTPVTRFYFEDNKVQAVDGNHGGTDEFGPFTYVRAMKQLAEEENVLLVDLFTETVKIIERLGEVDAMYLQNIKDESGATIGEARYNRPKYWVSDYDDIIEKKLFADFDNTHQNRFGSYVFASKIADIIAENACVNKAFAELSEHLLEKSIKTVAVPARLKPRLDEIKKMAGRIR